MRKVLFTGFVSLDGVMQAPGGPEEDRDGGFEYGGWTFHYWDEVMGQAMDKVFSAPFDLLLGRRTYDIFAAHWPRVSGDPIADKFNACTKYVATRSAAPLAWKGSVALRDAASEVRRLKEQDGPTLLIQGSSQLIQTLLAHKLIDEFTLLTFPVVLGKGKRLFGSGSQAGALKLTDTTRASTGVLINSYVPSGPVTMGSFALE